MKKVIVIFSGFNFRAVIAFIRTLEKNSLDYAIIAKSENDDIFKTKYYTKVEYVRKTKELNLDDILNGLNIIKENKKVVECLIAPSTEALNRFYLNNSALFHGENYIMPLVKKREYERLSDKLAFSKLCQKYGIKTPSEYLQPSEKYLPLVAKPKKYLSSGGVIHSPYIIDTKEEYQQFIEKNNLEDFYYQEYVNGRCIYLLYYYDKQGNVFKLSQENYIQQEHGKSMIYAKTSDFHDKEISSKFESLFIDEKFRGLVMVELKVVNDSCYMIEANPRFWGPSQLFVDANYNFFELLLYDYGYLCFNKVDASDFKNTKYFWDDGISNNISLRKKISFYNYSDKLFLEEKDTLKSIEIFNREDTNKLYGG
ncbi:ATP-grasp domain-containing protein [Francisella sp. 19X1-34]|uniref:ATP-grasp domain-containing protein n=1 Tax=Francisella sp. 19X1-34 TaxID=3087177 RepID=UPI002E34AA87|nr:ATP-grasp domain-containing protein [Francisella sp. 19X1-34]MED7788018.1 ATP-grasp domain-containing protein [Francisella sp. 19X1-34]